MKKQLWQESEEKAAKLYEGKLVPGSGRGKFAKMDVVAGKPKVKDWRLEVKNSTTGAFTVNKKLLEKLNKQAALGGYKFFLFIDLEGEPYVCIRDKWFRDLIDEQ